MSPAVGRVLLEPQKNSKKRPCAFEHQELVPYMHFESLS